MEQITPVDALKLAVGLAGGQSSLAEKLPVDADGKPVSSARVWNWVNRAQQAPAEACPDIEAITGVTCEQLRPDVNWSVLRKPSRKARITPAAAVHQSSTGTR